MDLTKYEEKYPNIESNDNIRFKTGHIIRVYKPLGDDILAQAASVVRDAIGYNRTRGDSVTITSWPIPRRDEWDAEDAATYINGLLGINLLKAESLQDVVNLVTEDPCYAVKYGLGYIALTDTLDQIKALDPSLSIKEIHKLFLDSQPATFEQIYETAKRHLEN